MCESFGLGFIYRRLDLIGGLLMRVESGVRGVRVDMILVRPNT